MNNTNIERFNRIHKAYKEYVREMLYQKTKDNSLVKDLCQDYWYKFYMKICSNSIDEKWESYNIKLHIRQILYEYYTSITFDKRRAQTEAISLSTSPYSDNDLTLDATIEDLNATQPDVNSIKETRNKVLLDVLKQLKPVEREYIELYYLEGKNCREIAKIYDVSYQSVSLRLEKILIKLKKILEKII